MNIAVVIPAYNPEEPLLLLVEALIKLDFRQIVVINDGSKPSYRDTFDKLAGMRNCSVVHHSVNLGKGRPLKSGFNYCAINFPDLLGIVTADADGRRFVFSAARKRRELSLSATSSIQRFTLSCLPLPSRGSEGSYRKG